jgi:hypothetical protein
MSSRIAITARRFAIREEIENGWELQRNLQFLFDSIVHT